MAECILGDLLPEIDVNLSCDTVSEKQLKTFEFESQDIEFIDVSECKIVLCNGKEICLNKSECVDNALKDVKESLSKGTQFKVSFSNKSL